MIGRIINIQHSAPWITEADIAKLSGILRSGMVASGRQVDEFETYCSNYLGLRYTWATNSGRAALIRVLMALDVQAGAEVVMPSYVCHAVADAVRSVGAIPVYCDVGSDFCVNSQTIAAAITANTAAIVAVHPFGIIADIKPLLEFCVPVIEDCCQCFSPRVGHIGAAAFFSFHATKCLTTGEGGMVATAMPEIAAKIATSFDIYPEISRMSDLQAGLGISQLARYEEMLRHRQAMAEQYMRTLPAHLTLRIASVADRSIFFRFPLSLDCGFAAVAERFNHRGVQVRHGVDALLHRKAGYKDKRFPMSVELFNKTLSLPFYPALGEEGVRYVLASAREILE